MEGPPMDHFADFWEALDFLESHEEFSVENIRIKPTKKSGKRAIKLQYYKTLSLQEADEETQKVMKKLRLKSIPLYDPDLECVAPTFEDAVIKLANLVYRKYGDGKQRKAKIHPKETAG